MLSSNQPSKIIQDYLFTHFTIQLDNQQVITIADSGCNSSAIVTNTIDAIEQGINDKVSNRTSIIQDIIINDKGTLRKQKITSMEVSSIIAKDQYLDYSRSVDTLI